MSDWRNLETNEDLYFSPYNVTWENERCVELALAFRWIEEKEASNIVEIGAVMPYYDENPYTPHMGKIIFTHDVIDPYDERATIRDFMENHDLSMKNVLTISTIEHIGTTDYDGSGERQQVYDETLAPLAFNKSWSKCLLFCHHSLLATIIALTHGWRKLTSFELLRLSQDPTWF